MVDDLRTDNVTVEPAQPPPNNEEAERLHLRALLAELEVARLTLQAQHRDES